MSKILLKHNIFNYSIFLSICNQILTKRLKCAILFTFTVDDRPTTQSWGGKSEHHPDFVGSGSG